MSTKKETAKNERANARDPARYFRLAVLLFFFASGATSLVIEVAWTRMLGVVFGNTVLAASTVLTAFMLGLALGSSILGRLADRIRNPLVLYGCLEIGVGLYALVFPLLADACGSFYGWYYRSMNPGAMSLDAIRFALSLVLLLPPTFLMGGTLPVLGRHLGFQHKTPGQEVGYLYGANTCGAVTGCFLAGFVFLDMLGVKQTLVLAGIAALAVGVLAIMLGRAIQQPGEEKEQNRKRTLPRRDPTLSPLSQSAFVLVLVSFAVAGFCSMAYEVIWTRILLFLLGTSVYAFASMLTSFLVGLAIGSLFSSRFLVQRILRPLLWFGVMEVLVGVASLATVPLLSQLNEIDALYINPHTTSSVTSVVLGYFANNFVVLLIPTFLMGAVFPVVITGCLYGESALGRRVGQVYAANTTGCVLGSLLAGFALIPVFGTHHSLLIVVALNFIVGLALIWKAIETSTLNRIGVVAPAVAVILIAFLLTPRDIFFKTINAFHQPSTISFIKEHSTGTVTVHDMPNNERLVAVDGVDVAGLDYMLRTTQKLQGYIPLCLHPNPRRVAQIGFGTGETVRVGLEFGVENYSIVEICPAIFEAGKYFEEINHGSYRDPRLRKIIMDGKNFALLTGEKFDIIMNDSIYPGASGSSALYTIDHFRNCRARLAEGGLFSCWVPLDIRPNQMRMILKSFQEVFPHTSVWIASNCIQKNSLLLGSLTPLKIDFARLKSVLGRPAIKDDLAAIDIHDVYDFLDCHMCDEASIRDMVKNDPINSDDRPRLEFSCAVKPPWVIRLRADVAMLTAFRSPIAPSVVNFTDAAQDQAELGRRFEATTHVFRAQLAQLENMPKARLAELDLASKACPGETHVKTNEAELAREINSLRNVLVDYPGNQTFVQRLADKYFAACRFEEAVQLYEQLIKANPRPPATVFVRLADIGIFNGRIADAEELLRRCLAFWPKSADAHDKLGGICLKTRRIDEAWLHLKEAQRLDPGNPIYEAHKAELMKMQ